VLAVVDGYGPLRALLDDPMVEEVWINAPDRVHCELSRGTRPGLAVAAIGDEGRHQAQSPSRHLQRVPQLGTAAAGKPADGVLSADRATS